MGQRIKRSDEAKRELILEAERPGESVATVAKRHRVNPGLLYRWKRELLPTPKNIDKITLPAVVAKASSEIDTLKQRVTFLETSLRLAHEQITLYRTFIHDFTGIRL